MPTVSQSLDFASSPDQVWAVASDFSRYGEWNVTHTDFPEGAPQAQPNATFKEKVTIMGMPGEATWTVTEVEPAQRIIMSGEGPMGVKLGSKLELARNGDGTTVTMEASFDGGPLVGPMGDAVAKSAEQAGAESLEKLRALVA
jgi:carbon monoxide dehydrogenase subunit G